MIRGDEWVNGQVLADLARIAGIDLQQVTELPRAELFARLCWVQQAARRYLQQLPDDSLDRLLPNRPRSYAELVYHIFNIADMLLEHERGIPLVWDAYNRVPEPGKGTKTALTAYGEAVFEGLQRWWIETGSCKDFTQPAQVYYGRQTLREFLERTTWHSGQHTRQLMMVMQMLDISPDGPLGAETFAGLPMPEKVWDE